MRMAVEKHADFSVYCPFKENPSQSIPKGDIYIPQIVRFRVNTCFLETSEFTKTEIKNN